MPAAPVHMSCEVTHLETRDNQPVSVVCVTGDIDLTTAGELRAEMNRLLTSERPARLVLDLNGVVHIDSSGVGTLLEGLRKADRSQVRFVLCGLNDAARRMLERTRLSLVFDTRPTVQDALHDALHDALQDDALQTEALYQS
jgi:anti-sigma B factor antagonist